MEMITWQKVSFANNRPDRACNVQSAHLCLITLQNAYKFTYEITPMQFTIQVAAIF